jgi:hypothetical protein
VTSKSKANRRPKPSASPSTRHLPLPPLAAGRPVDELRRPGSAPAERRRPAPCAAHVGGWGRGSTRQAWTARPPRVLRRATSSRHRTAFSLPGPTCCDRCCTCATPPEAWAALPSLSAHLRPSDSGLKILVSAVQFRPRTQIFERDATSEVLRGVGFLCSFRSKTPRNAMRVWRRTTEPSTCVFECVRRHSRPLVQHHELIGVRACTVVVSTAEVVGVEIAKLAQSKRRGRRFDACGQSKLASVMTSGSI